MVLAYLPFAAQLAGYVVLMALYARRHILLRHHVAGIVMGVLIPPAVAQL